MAAPLRKSKFQRLAQASSSTTATPSLRSYSQPTPATPSNVSSSIPTLEAPLDLEVEIYTATLDGIVQTDGSNQSNKGKERDNGNAIGEVSESDKGRRESNEAEKDKAKTRNRILLGDWGLDTFDNIRNHRAIKYMLSHEANDDFGLPCSCVSPAADASSSMLTSDAIRTVMCNDCIQYTPSCTACFISDHRNNPLHWAEVWNFKKGFLERKDLSDLGHILYLGHGGGQCPQTVSKEPVIFSVIHSNGVHGIRAHFCLCSGTFDRVEQLMKARLFPATIRRPETAFTFEFLHTFHLHHLESNVTAYDYMSATRRLTDNAFPSETPNHDANFLRTMRIWRIFTVVKRMGQAHGIEGVLTDREGGHLIVYCPACPLNGFNMEIGWERTPPAVRHLHQGQTTIDGNFQANEFLKNNDTEDYSLTGGYAYYPEARVFKEYLRKIPPRSRTSEKSTCNFIRAVNEQDSKKFKNMAVTGIVACQCSHVYVWSVVDLNFGERYVNVDLALASAIRRRLKAGDDLSTVDFRLSCDEITSYDAMCQYSVNIVRRFKEHPDLQDLVPIIEKMRFSIPALHIQNHKEDCMYEFSTAYLECVGHFFGETAEMVWPELNELGPQTRQMNNGHRQGVLEDKFGHWNWVKTENMAVSLANDIERFIRLWAEKRQVFLSLTKSHGNKVKTWRETDRKSSRDSNSKHVLSVYRHSPSAKVPSQTVVYEQMVKDQQARLDTRKRDATRLTDAAGFLNMGIFIERDQRALRAKVARQEVHELKSQETQIKKARKTLVHEIEQWREEQRVYMPHLFSVVKEPERASDPEDEKLYLPSALSTAQREEACLSPLAQMEISLRQGEANDSILDAQSAAKSGSFMGIWRQTHDRGQEQNRRSLSKVKTAEAMLDIAISNYMAARDALIRLDYIDSENEQYPPMTKDDAYRTPTSNRRRLGDSQRRDGALWGGSFAKAATQNAQVRSKTTAASASDADVPQASSSDDQAYSGTQMTRRKRPSKPSGGSQKKKLKTGDEKRGKKEEKKERENGWIWNVRRSNNMTESEMKDWMDESDRVQWFRAEAEYHRFLEAWEAKQAEFLRVIKSFSEMSIRWAERGEVGESPGHVAYARQKSAMWSRMENNARTMFQKLGFADRLDLKEGDLLSKRVLKDREDLDSVLRRHGLVEFVLDDIEGLDSLVDEAVLLGKEGSYGAVSTDSLD